MLKVGLVSRWHVHADEYANAVRQYENAEIAAVWDENAERGKKWAQELGCRYFGDYGMMLRKADIDAVVIVSPTSMHPSLILKAAKAGKHIFTEKALTVKLNDSKKIAAAVKENNVKFVISFPHKSRCELIFAKSAIESGRLGKITYARVRNVHNGSSAGWLPDYFFDELLCGGGAMIDLGAHPMYTLEMLLGKPLFVQSLFTDLTKRGVEDNAVSLIEFECGAIGVSETGFVSEYNPYTVEISGTDGYLAIRGSKVLIADKLTEGRLVEVDHLPANKPLPIVQWMDWCCNIQDAPEGILIDDAVMLTALTHASYKANKNGDKTYVEF